MRRFIGYGIKSTFKTQLFRTEIFPVLIAFIFLLHIQSKSWHWHILVLLSFIVITICYALEFPFISVMSWKHFLYLSRRVKWLDWKQKLNSETCVYDVSLFDFLLIISVRSIVKVRIAYISFPILNICKLSWRLRLLRWLAKWVNDFISWPCIWKSTGKTRIFN